MLLYDYVSERVLEMPDRVDVGARQVLPGHSAIESPISLLLGIGDGHDAQVQLVVSKQAASELLAQLTRALS